MAGGGLCTRAKASPRPDAVTTDAATPAAPTWKNCRREYVPGLFILVPPSPAWMVDSARGAWRLTGRVAHRLCNGAWRMSSRPPSRSDIPMIFPLCFVAATIYRREPVQVDEVTSRLDKFRAAGQSLGTQSAPGESS